MDLATKPKQVDEWLARLPYANPVEAAAELTDFLATCARLRLASERLDKILERVMPTVEGLVHALREKFSADGLPLPPNRQHAADLCGRLNQEIGHFCKLIVIEFTGKRFQLFGVKPVGRHLYLLMQSLKDVLEVSSDTHQSPPAGIWADMHRTYEFATRTGWAKMLPPGCGDGPCIEDIYKGALLLALADPFRIPREELVATKNLIRQYRGLAELVRGDDANRHGCVFAIDPNVDSPAIVLSREPMTVSSQWSLLLNPTQLVKRLSLLASQHARDNKPVQSRPQGASDDLAYLEMLHRLKTQWGGSVQRLGNRRPRNESMRYEVIFGLQAIHKRLALPDEDIAVSPYAVEPEPATCLLVNDSVGGMALSEERSMSFSLRIGELAGVRHDRAEQWSIGIVRWFRSNRTGKSSFGLQLLAPRAASIRLRREDNGDTMSGLWLPATPSLRQGEMVLCQGGKLAVGATATFQNGDSHEARIRLEQLAEYTPAIEAYRYRAL